ncbi:hypothetical protein [Streptomyces sp. SGAir0957]
MADEMYRAAVRARLAESCGLARELERTTRAAVGKLRRQLEENYELRREQAHLLEGRARRRQGGGADGERRE